MCQQANAIEVLDTNPNATDCTRVGQRNVHRIAPATPPANATHVIATGAGPCGPSALTNNAIRHSASEAEMNAIMARVAALMPCAWR